MPMNPLVSIRAKFERFPAAVKGALLVRGADGQPHQIRLEGARVAELGGGQAHPVGIEAVVLEASPNQDTFVPFEISTMEMAAGWYRLECEVVVDGVPSVVHPGEPFAMPWPRAAVRRGTVTIGAKVAAVALESVECLGDVIRVPVRLRRTARDLAVGGRAAASDPGRRVRPRGRARPRHRLSRAPCRRAPHDRARRRDPRGGRAPVAVSVATPRVAACGVGRSMPSIRAGARGAARARGRSAPTVSATCVRWRRRGAGAAAVPPSCAVPTCRDCPPPPLDSARAAFVYDGPARRAIHRLKFSGWRDVAAAMADAMAAVGPPAAADVVTWVPLARGRRAERGYDQARALAVALAHRLDLPATRLVRRSVATDPQARRSGAERRTAMRGVFRAVRAVPGPGPAGRRRADDRRHPGRGGRGPACRRRPRSPRAGRCAFLAGQGLVAGRRPVGLSSGGLTFGSVVARGCSPVVDASRGRNDPRKATVGG